MGADAVMGVGIGMWMWMWWCGCGCGCVGVSPVVGLVLANYSYDALGSFG